MIGQLAKVIDNKGVERIIQVVDITIKDKHGNSYGCNQILGFTNRISYDDLPDQSDGTVWNYKGTQSK